MRTPLSIVLVAATLFLAAPPVEAETTHERLIGANADAIVSIKFVVNVHITMGGHSMDREFSGTVTGVVIDPVGLIVAAAPDLASSQFEGMEINWTPTSLLVTVPGDPKEYDAVLGATDSRLGLAFLRIRDLGGKKLRAVDTSVTAVPKLGDVVYGVTRLSQGFDHAPYCDEAMIVGHVTKPRPMWLLQGRFTEVAHPLFNAQGALLGWLIGEEGVDEEETFPFLLPLEAAQSTLARGATEAQRALEEALEREAEGGSPTSPAPADTAEGAPPDDPEADGDGGGEADEE